MDHGLNFIHKSTIDHTLVDNILEDFLNKKNSWTIAPSTRGYELLSSNYMSSSLKFQYLRAVTTVAREYTTTYPYSTNGHNNWQANPVFNLQHYHPGHHYSAWHCENNGESQFNKRHLAFMTYLNTVETGGETEFLYQNTKVKPEKGLTLLWPAYFTHTHRGIPAPAEDKYIITGWFEFLDMEKHHTSMMDLDDEDFYQEVDNFNDKTL